VVTWSFAGALAGFSAILIAPSTSLTVFFMTSLLLRSLAAALIGGLTSIGGALAAGIALGVVEALIGYKSPTIGLTEVVLAVLVIAVLLVRPQGLVRARY
jgi:branched-subunit amino acid ABC-type transport system permease component